MSLGGGSTTVTQNVSPAQEAQMNATTGFLTNTIIPTYQGIANSVNQEYNQSAGGVQNAAQNLASTASQAQQTLGSTGESQLNQGTAGLESLFSPNYEANQVAAALQPAQAQYLQNQAGLQSQFGAAGEIGSSRNALAAQQLAATNAASQANTAAQVEANIESQRANAGTALAQLGQAGLSGAQSAAGNVVNASQAPMNYLGSTSGILYGTPASSYTGNYSGTQGSTTNSVSGKLGVGSLFSNLGL
jgi:hypothetical protein